MPQRMTAESVERDEHGIQNQDDRADTDAKMFMPGRIRKPHPEKRVIGQQKNKGHREVEKIAMNILNDKRKAVFAEIRFARFTDSATNRVSPERFVIRAAIIIASEAKPCGHPQNQEGRRERRQKRRPPGRLNTEKRVRRSAPKFGRVKWRQIIRAVAAIPVSTGIVVGRVKGRPGRIDYEGGETEEYEQRLHPPRIRPHGFAKAAWLDRSVGVRHKGRPETCQCRKSNNPKAIRIKNESVLIELINGSYTIY